MKARSALTNFKRIPWDGTAAWSSAISRRAHVELMLRGVWDWRMTSDWCWTLCSDGVSNSTIDWCEMNWIYRLSWDSVTGDSLSGGIQRCYCNIIAPLLHNELLVIEDMLLSTLARNILLYYCRVIANDLFLEERNVQKSKVMYFKWTFAHRASSDKASTKANNINHTNNNKYKSNKWIWFVYACWCACLNIFCGRKFT